MFEVAIVALLILIAVLLALVCDALDRIAELLVWQVEADDDEPPPGEEAPQVDPQPNVVLLRRVG